MPEKSHPRPFSARVGGVFMSAQKTEHYQLHQWEPGDSVLRREFNENFAKIDTAARIVVGTYVGDGAESRHIELGFQPRAVLVANDHGQMSAYNTAACGGLTVPGLTLYQQGNAPVMKIDETGFTVYRKLADVGSAYMVRANWPDQTFIYLALR